MRWTDCNLDSGLLTILQTVQRIHGKGLVKAPTKTEESRRVLPVGRCCGLLQIVKAAQNLRRLELGSLWKDNDLVFHGPDGSPMNPDKITHRFARAAADAGLPGLRYHDLRHAHGSFLLAKGVGVKVVSARLGHSNVNITLNTYGHVLHDQQAEAAKVFGDSIREARLASTQLWSTKRWQKGAF